MTREGERLAARIRQIRRALAPAEVGPDPAPPVDGDLRARVAHLEQLVQGLQDSVYRESHRQERRIADLENKIEPTALAAALSKDARERGL